MCLESEIQPKIPDWAFVISKLEVWKWGKYEATQSSKMTQS